MDWPFLLSLLSTLSYSGHNQETPRAVLTWYPKWSEIYKGETLILTCGIRGSPDDDWEYRWILNGLLFTPHQSSQLRISPADFSHNGNYSCVGEHRSDRQTSEMSETFSVEIHPTPVAQLSVSPTPWVADGYSVNLLCEVSPSTADWSIFWFQSTVPSPLSEGFSEVNEVYSLHVGAYALSSDGPNRTGFYKCSAGRGKTIYRTAQSRPQPIYVEGTSPSASLLISPDSVQHFMGESLQLTCEVQGNQTHWSVKRVSSNPLIDFTCGFDWGSQTGTTCTLTLTLFEDNGVYWCESETGEYSHPVNISVGLKTILKSPVHPVAEGGAVTLSCRSRDARTTLRAEFYRDGLLIGNESTAEMTIHHVYKSDEGWYSCGIQGILSPKSWMGVRCQTTPPVPSPSPASISLPRLLCSLVVTSPYLLVTIMMLEKCCRRSARCDEDQIGTRDVATSDPLVCIELD